MQAEIVGASGLEILVVTMLEVGSAPPRVQGRYQKRGKGGWGRRGGQPKWWGGVVSRSRDTE